MRWLLWKYERLRWRLTMARWTLRRRIKRWWRYRHETPFQRTLRLELEAGLQKAIDDQILYGDGTAEPQGITDGSEHG